MAAVYSERTKLTPDEALKLKAMLERNFSASERLTVQASMECVPVVVANVRKQTRSFSLGQKIYIYDVYWGMNDNAKVVARYRRKHDWIRGVIPIRNLENFRFGMAYEPVVIRKLVDETISRHLFARFLEEPDFEDGGLYVFPLPTIVEQVRRFFAWFGRQKE